MNRVLLFLSMCVAGGLGGAVGSMLGHAAGKGGLLVGGALGGVLFVVADGFLAERMGWIDPPHRVWTVTGGVFGFILACLVALSTLSSPIGPVLSTLLIGTGALLGFTLGRSAHEKGLTTERRAR